MRVEFVGHPVLDQSEEEVQIVVKLERQFQEIE
jgi:hypothetical protein